MSNFQKDVYQNAIDHGFWDCKLCGGEKQYPTTLVDENEYQQQGLATCPVCKGTGLHREDAESLALVHAEVSEALETLRDPKHMHCCTKCSGKKFVLEEKKFENGETGPFAVECPKCDGDGLPLGGTRFAEELADVYIRLLDLAAHHGIDMKEVANAKHAYNVTRPRKHGKTF